MKYVNNISGFINEKSQNYDEVSGLISDFLELDEYNHLDGHNFCVGGFYKYSDEELSKIFKELDKYLKENGIDFAEFYRNNKKDILKDNFYISDAFMDALLYQYDKSTELGGINMDCYEYASELIIKYDYGFQNYDMGKKWLLQNFDSLEEFYSLAAKNYIKSLIEGETEESKKEILDYATPTINVDILINNVSYSIDFDKYSIAVIDLKLFYACLEVSGGTVNYQKFKKMMVTAPEKGTANIEENNTWSFYGNDILLIAFGELKNLPKNLVQVVVGNSKFKEILNSIEVNRDTILAKLDATKFGI